jgi:hypothetical protein
LRCPSTPLDVFVASRAVAVTTGLSAAAPLIASLALEPSVTPYSPRAYFGREDHARSHGVRLGQGQQSKIYRLSEMLHAQMYGPVARYQWVSRQTMQNANNPRKGVQLIFQPTFATLAQQSWSCSRRGYEDTLSHAIGHEQRRRRRASPPKIETRNRGPTTRNRGPTMHNRRLSDLRCLDPTVTLQALVL